MAKISQDQLEHWFGRKPQPTPQMDAAFNELRRAGQQFAETIVRLTPPSADQSSAIRKIREAVYSAISAIECEGR